MQNTKNNIIYYKDRDKQGIGTQSKKTKTQQSAGKKSGKEWRGRN